MTLLTKGSPITKVRGTNRVHGEPERVNRFPMPLGNMLTIAWKNAHEILVDEILDQSLLHWRHAFVDYKAIEVQDSVGSFAGI